MSSSTFTMDVESLSKCALGDLESGLEDHPDNFMRVQLLTAPLSHPEVSSESVNKLHEDYAEYIRAQAEIESELALLNAQLEAVNNRKTFVAHKRQAIRNDLENLTERSKQTQAEKPTSGGIRYFQEGAQAVQTKLSAKREKVTQAEGSVADVLCIHEMSGECLDPQCPYFHTSR